MHHEAAHQIRVRFSRAFIIATTTTTTRFVLLTYRSSQRLKALSLRTEASILLAMLRAAELKRESSKRFVKFGQRTDDRASA